MYCAREVKEENIGCLFENSPEFLSSPYLQTKMATFERKGKKKWCQKVLLSMLESYHAVTVTPLIPMVCSYKRRVILGPFLFGHLHWTPCQLCFQDDHIQLRCCIEYDINSPGENKMTVCSKKMGK